MAMDANELKEWVDSLKPGALVAIDDGGLILIQVGVSENYIEIGGEPLDTDTEGLRICPNCDSAEHIDILAHVWVRLVQEEGTDNFQTDADLASDGSHVWDEHDDAVCSQCAWFGKVRDLKIGTTK